MALKPFDEMMEVDIEPYLKERDGMKYLPWGECAKLLHENGASEVYFVPIEAPGGGFIHCTPDTFGDKDKDTNGAYFTVIEIHIDDLVFEQKSPIMNGKAVVHRRTMSQQRVHNSMTRSFVKGVAIRTGLGFKLWVKSEQEETAPDDITKHDITKIQTRVLETLTALQKKGMDVPAIAEAVGMDEHSLRAQFSYFAVLFNLEKELNDLLIKTK